MKKRKPIGLALVDRKQSRTGATEDVAVMRLMQRKPLGSVPTGPPGPGSTSGSTMPGGAPRPRSSPKAKTRGRLNRAVLAMLGKGLEECFDEIRKQEVPERFKLLLQQF
jgi:hypothetical protein